MKQMRERKPTMRPTTIRRKNFSSTRRQVGRAITFHGENTLYKADMGE